MSAYDEMRAAFRTARQYCRASDEAANEAAELLQGRLRKVSSYKLRRLKRELRDFNAHTGRWKEETK